MKAWSTGALEPGACHPGPTTAFIGLSSSAHWTLDYPGNIEKGM